MAYEPYNPAGNPFPSRSTERDEPNKFAFDNKQEGWVASSIPMTMEDAMAALDKKTEENMNALGLGGPSSSTSAKNTSKGKANKEFIETEFFTLEGECSVIATKKTIKIKAGDTINQFGLGKFLSGQYFVDTVTRKIDNSSGYSHSLGLQKNGFADSLKAGAKNEAVSARGDDKDASEIKKNVSDKSHIIQSSDTLWALAVKYYSDGTKYTKIAEANNIKEKDFTRLVVGQELIIP